MQATQGAKAWCFYRPHYIIKTTFAAFLATCAIDFIYCYLCNFLQLQHLNYQHFERKCLYSPDEESPKPIYLNSS